MRTRRGHLFLAGQGDATANPDERRLGAAVDVAQLVRAPTRPALLIEARGLKTSQTRALVVRGAHGGVARRSGRRLEPGHGLQLEGVGQAAEDDPEVVGGIGGEAQDALGHGREAQLLLQALLTGELGHVEMPHERLRLGQIDSPGPGQTHDPKQHNLSSLMVRGQFKHKKPHLASRGLA